MQILFSSTILKLKNKGEKLITAKKQQHYLLRKNDFKWKLNVHVRFYTAG